jgi:hypothetical protein
MPYAAGNRSLLRALLLTNLMVLFVFTCRVDAAGPRLILVDGGALTKPVILDDWKENVDLIHALAEEAKVQQEELAGRPYLELAFFSGPYWAHYVDDGRSLDQLRLESGDQRGRLYPGVGGSAPIITYDAGARRVAPEGIAILSRHGIPVLIQSEQPVVGRFALLVAGLAIVCLVAIASWLHKNRKQLFG